MPNRDGTGPNGQGAFTGRRMGDCKNDSQDSNLDFDCNRRGAGRRMGARAVGSIGQGMGRGMGFGRGCRRAKMD